MNPKLLQSLVSVGLLATVALPLAARAAPPPPPSCAPVLDPATNRPRLVPDMPTVLPDRPRTPLPTPPLSATAVLPLEGELGVSQGAATYTIPIVVPPGRKMTPSFALTYSSHGAASTLGFGWSLSGEQRIHRCSSTFARDRSSRPVMFDQDDKLCLNGDRLVLDSAVHTYGQPGAAYRLEHDDWTRIEQQGALDDVSTCFMATRRDGRTLEFGGCSDPNAAELLIGQSAPWSWALRRESDLQGNEIDYGYSYFMTQQVLSRVSYTHHRGTQTPGTREVLFDYAERPDVTWRYIRGATLENVARLVSIRTQVHGSLARKYELTYAQSEASRRSLLVSVRACTQVDGSLACLPSASTLPTTFTYDDAVRTYTVERLPAANHLRERYAFLGDVDGDGINDRLRSEYPHDSGGTPLANHLELSSSGTSVDLATLGLNPRWSPGLTLSERSRDLDLDGRVDVEGRSGGFVAFTSFDPATRRMRPRTLTNIPEDVYYNFISLDTDGYIDAVTVSNGHVELRRQVSPYDGTTFRIDHIEPVSSCQTVKLVSDLNGDGTADIVVTDASHFPCAASDFILMSNPGSSGSPPTFSRVMPASLGLPRYLGTAKIKFLDINGDGLRDVVREQGLAGLVRNDPDVDSSDNGSAVWSNTAGAFRSVAAGVIPDRTGIFSAKGYAYVVADSNGDGRDEFLTPWAPVDFARSAPWSYFPNPNATEPIEYYTDGFAAPQYNISNSYGAFDRSVYSWRAIDFVMQAGGALSVRHRSTTIEAPGNNLSFHFNASGAGSLDGFSFIQPLWSGPAQPYPSWRVGNYVAPGAYNIGYGSFLLKSDAATVDRLLSVDRGAGLSETIEYRALSQSHGTACPGPLYTAQVAPGSVTNGRHLVDASMVVVARVERPDGLGGEVSTCYQYENGWWNAHGRGFQAFEAIHEVERVPGDTANDLRTRTEYHTDFPLEGRLRKKDVFLASDGPGVLPILETAQAWHSTCFTSPLGVQSCVTDRRTPG